ncbi:hypothetical protein FAZ69_16870 [Trinickia terrae]|uniref:Uncharacterized protein n=1 Tax=Trinickia terrae TaxID=2571161 RepID=A0A4U1I3V2_9BURK|nr:hypothetical protein [Trinickia terrae]TKC87931.1 hypothetical protein FAZ69_16870 [Trinickia terrae]
MMTFESTAGFIDDSFPPLGKPSTAAPASDDRPSPYATLLQAPMSSLASNVSERADVSSIAILGYN